MLQVNLALQEPLLIDAATRTATMQFYSGAAVDRFDFWTGDMYTLRFEVTDEACDLGRLRAGAPLLKVHDQYSLESVAGVVREAWLDGGKAFAKVQFSEREDVEPIWKDVQSGIIRHVSMGAAIRESKRIEKNGKLSELIALRWEPQEISIVPVPADPGAAFLADGQPPEWLARLMSSRAGASRSEKQGTQAIEFAARVLKGQK